MTNSYPQFDDFDLYLYSQAGEKIALLNNYTKFFSKPILNDVGNWFITIPSNNPQVLLFEKGGFISLLRNKEEIFGGFIHSFKISGKGNLTNYTFGGPGQNVLLKARIIIPEPATLAPPYNTDIYHEVTGIASSVIYEYVRKHLGEEARPGRIHPNLTYAVDPGLGNYSKTWQGRWHILIDLMKTIANSEGNIGFDIKNNKFRVYQTRDLSSEIVFSRDLGNLESYEFSTEIPETTYLFAGDSEVGLGKTIVEKQNSTTEIEWGMRLEEFSGLGSSADFEDLNSKADAALSEKSEKNSLSILPTEKSGIQYGINYELGDTIKAIIGEYGEFTVQNIIRAVEITLEKGIVQIKPTISTTNIEINPSLSKLFKNSLLLKLKINQLESI